MKRRNKMARDKKVLRESMIEELGKLEEQERLVISERLHEGLFQSELWKNAETIGIYISFGNEWDTKNIIEEAFRSGKNIAIPKTIPATKQMDFYQITDWSQVRKGHFGIQEPIVEKVAYVEKDKIDLLIVPGLIFSKDGYRIGHGGGYYDRFLVDFIHPTVSLVSKKQLRDTLPINNYDLPVNYLITEDGFIN